jgi:hypothetical protein
MRVNGIGGMAWLVLPGQFGPETMSKSFSIAMVTGVN